MSGQGWKRIISPTNTRTSKNNTKSRGSNIRSSFRQWCRKKLTKQQFVLGDNVASFSPEVVVELFDITNRRLKTQGTVTLQFQLVDEESPDPLIQSFIVVDGIPKNCVLGSDALYGHKFIFDGSEWTIYRMRKLDQPTHEPVMMTPRKITISPYTDQYLFLVQRPYSRRESASAPLFRKKQGNELFRIVIINETDKQITIPAFRVLGTVVFTEEKPNTQLPPAPTKTRRLTPTSSTKPWQKFRAKKNKPCESSSKIMAICLLLKQKIGSRIGSWKNRTSQAHDRHARQRTYPFTALSELPTTKRSRGGNHPGNT
ncbi:hypothetical protein OUZ56_012498 [Daphnia magna]|uniref:Uncharacterized protein n=1 Tax=Daphnia magna TaxID=35525 RepID=A0ABQ9Z391_9CRUS|nr:hypothetical protein OUZ56_012498 [Daphnia magna]